MMKIPITAQSVYGNHPLQMFTEKYRINLTSMETFNRTTKLRNNTIDKGIYAIKMNSFEDLQRLYKLIGFKPLKYDGKKITIMDEDYWQF